MEKPRYLVGIDLGTTNCAVAFVDTKGKRKASAETRPFLVRQLVAAGETRDRAMLPSFLYLPAGPELPPDASVLPWNRNADRIVGEFARTQGARVPGRLVASAKSWLCHAGVDREAAILPWQAPSEVPRVSPVEASAAYLGHIRDAWNYQVAQGDQTQHLEHQEIVLTVPASFDEAARELTVEASKKVGFERLTLLEEPQAAFYCWIVTHRDGWQKQLKAGEQILVCDIGGGTTDFSLITVVETPEGPGFRRVAVGDHLLLGGDNIDLALAHRVESRLGSSRLDAEQWSALRYACRSAKEQLLREDGPERSPVTIAGRGSKIIGGSLHTELTRSEVNEVALDGFFPMVDRETTLARAGRAGFQEFGLPFVADPAIPKHLAAFLRRHELSVTSGSGAKEPNEIGVDRMIRPDAILFNGGALTPKVVRDRIVGVLRSWFQSEDPSYQPRVLSNDSLDLAVAVGAAYYGVVRRGGGIRIGGGTARSFYIGLRSPDQEVEASEKPKEEASWICTVPRDAQEGDEFQIKGRTFELLVDRPVIFPLATSSVKPQDQPGDLVASDPDAILELPPLAGVMRVGRKAKADRVPIELAARVTEVGTVELWCQSQNDDRRWKLQIQFRNPSGPAESNPASKTLLSDAGLSGSEEIVEQSLVDAATSAVHSAFIEPDPQAEKGAARLVKRLEEVLERPRDQWPPSTLRALWEPIHGALEERRRSERHEQRWLNLAGYCLRPGVGFPMDQTRIKSLWSIFHQGLHFSKDLQCWVEWWVLWRRVAAGLNRGHHGEIYRRIAPLLLPGKGGPGQAAKKLGRPKPEAHEIAEMWRCVCGMERLDASQKVGLGDQLINSIGKPTQPKSAFWGLGRLGARLPLFGPANTVVPLDVASRWGAALLEAEPSNQREADDLRFALIQLGRVSSDRARDLDESLRPRLLERLRALGASDEALNPVRSYVPLESSQQSIALGDSIPVGLRLVEDQEPETG